MVRGLLGSRPPVERASGDSVRCPKIRRCLRGFSCFYRCCEWFSFLNCPIVLLYSTWLTQYILLAALELVKICCSWYEVFEIDVVELSGGIIECIRTSDGEKNQCISLQSGNPLITPSNATSATALAGNARNIQGPNPLQNPLTPSRLQIALAVSFHL